MLAPFGNLIHDTHAAKLKTHLSNDTNSLIRGKGNTIAHLQACKAKEIADIVIWLDSILPDVSVSDQLVFLVFCFILHLINTNS